MIKSSNRRTFACAGVSMLALAFATGAALPAMAQEKNGKLDVIVVTAQKRQENAQNVPISIATKTGDDLQTMFVDGETVLAMAARIPSLNMESSNGRVAPRFYIRGLGNADFDLAASQPVSVIMDDVVMENVILKSTPLFDVANVEVLRGPQGTLFGRNTTAGIVKFESVKPSQEFDARLSTSWGRFNTVTIDAAMGGPLVKDKLAGRISGYLARRDDWIDNGWTGEQDAMGGFRELAGRGQLLFTPNEQFDALLSAHYRDLDGTSSLFRANILGPGNNNLNGNYNRGAVFYDEGNNNPQRYKGKGISLKMNYDTDMGTFTSISAYEETHGYSLGDIDGGFGAVYLPYMGPGFIPFNSATQDGIDYLDQYTQEVRFASNTSGPIDWQVGAYFFDSKFQITTNPFFVAPSSVVHSNTAWAVFGHAEMDAGNNTRIIAGARYTDDSKDLSVPASPIPTPDEHVADNRISWDVALQHSATENVNLYARVATGFRAPTIQARDVAFFGAPSIAQSEKILSGEAGFKSQLAADTLRFNAAAFVYRVNDMQLSAIGGGANFVHLINARRGVGYGLEADLEWLPSENLMITAGASWNHTELQDPNLVTAPCGSGLCTVLDPLDNNGNAILDGNPFVQAPDFTANITARYTHPINARGELFAETDWSIQGKINFFLYESAEFNSNGNFEGGAQFGYQRFDGTLEAAFVLRNLTDEKNVLGGIDFNNLTGYTNEPSFYGVRITIRN